MQPMAAARILALAKAGRSSAARIAMIAMTTSNSIKVKAVLALRCIGAPQYWRIRKNVCPIPGVLSGTLCGLFWLTAWNHGPAAEPACSNSPEPVQDRFRLPPETTGGLNLAPTERGRAVQALRELPGSLMGFLTPVAGSPVNHSQWASPPAFPQPSHNG